MPSADVDADVGGGGGNDDDTLDAGEENENVVVVVVIVNDLLWWIPFSFSFSSFFWRQTLLCSFTVAFIRNRGDSEVG